jgi:phosphatidate cytidylyltransferase
MLRTRIVTALIAVPLVLAAIFGLPPRGWGALSLFVVVAAAGEWATLAGYQKQTWMVFVGGTLLIGLDLLLGPVNGFDARHGWPDDIVVYCCGAATLFWVAIAPLWLYFGWHVKSKVIVIALGWLILLSTWVAVVQLQARSPALLLAMMAIVWIADTAAYFAGRRFGKRKLAPSISPGKTWEGVFGALLAVGVYACALTAFATYGGYTRPVTFAAVIIWIGVVMFLAALSVAGDLFESLLKRQGGVKDSGTILPGHGGIFDRIDALLAAMPAAALVAFGLLR